MDTSNFLVTMIVWSCEKENDGERKSTVIFRAWKKNCREYGKNEALKSYYYYSGKRIFLHMLQKLPSALRRGRC